MPSRREEWKRWGRVEVTRDDKGRFVSWRKIVAAYEGKKIALYGCCKTRYGTYTARYEFYGGNGKALQKCMIVASRLPPKQRYVTVNVYDFLRNPFKFGTKGYWLEKQTES